MKRIISEVTKVKRRVLTEVARLAFAGNLIQEIDKLPHKLTEEGVRESRCCSYKERAVLSARIGQAMGADLREFNYCTRLSDAARGVLSGAVSPGPGVQVMEVACDRCPIDKYIVTDACRNCTGHFCAAACPRKAIQTIHNKAFIDHQKCVECGLCSKACPFGAILEVSRPCERACPVGAVRPGQKRNAIIDETKCVECGACILACPFGAITDRAQVVSVIQSLINPAKKVVALVAPSLAGQFGPLVSPAQIRAALLRLGFSDVMETALGADAVAAAEAAEFQERLGGDAFITSSCCPAFVNLVQKHFPDLAGHLSTTVSPMIAAAQKIKAAMPDTEVVFIGPCVAKKGEALDHGCGLIDGVLTFEELAAMFVAKEINVAEIQTDRLWAEASTLGRNFAQSGGVAKALAASLPPTVTFSPCLGNGLASCLDLLKQAANGAIEWNFLEGMACIGGCIGGPGALADEKAAVRALEKHANESPWEKPADNPSILGFSLADLHQKK